MIFFPFLFALCPAHHEILFTAWKLILQVVTAPNQPSVGKGSTKVVVDEAATFCQLGPTIVSFKIEIVTSSLSEVEQQPEMLQLL